jgi:hypothetical protein
MRIRWFAICVGWARAVRDWAHHLIAPWLRFGGRFFRGSSGALGRRIRALRRWLIARVTRVG